MTPPTPPAPRLIHLLAIAARNTQRISEAGIADLGITAAQGGALLVIGEQGAATIGELATRLRLAQSAASTLAQRLEAAGMIRRATPAHDARQTQLHLTPAGEAARAALATRAPALNAQLMAGFTAEELALIARFLSHAATLPHTPAGDPA